MGSTNLEIVERAYERFKRVGSPDPELVAPGFVWDMTNMIGWPEEMTFEGAEGMRRFLAEWAAAWEDWQLEVDSLHEVGDKVVAVMRQHARSRATGMSVEMQFAQVWTMRDGRYLRMDMYSDPQAALADARGDL